MVCETVGIGKSVFTYEKEKSMFSLSLAGIVNAYSPGWTLKSRPLQSGTSSLASFQAKIHKDTHACTN